MRAESFTRQKLRSRAAQVCRVYDIGIILVIGCVGVGNVLELRGDRVRQFVNGKLATEGSEALPSSGKILFQSEGAEVFLRDIKLFPLKQ